MEIYKDSDLLKISGIQGKPIAGVIVKKLQRISDERGEILHMLRNDDSLFTQFGEIYFSKVYKDVVKAWHLHKEMELNYAVIYGMIKLVMYDDRDGSETKGNLLEIFTGVDNYLLVKIPPKVWNGFKGITLPFSLLANCSSTPHHKDEIIRMDPFETDIISYDWSLKHG